MTDSDQVRIELWHPEPSCMESDTEMLGGILHACVHAGASVGFVLPFSVEDAKAFWHDKVLPAVGTGSCHLFVARSGESIVGTVQLELAPFPNQSHRAEAKKLLVHPDARRRGIARRLMMVLEDHARDMHRSLITLDTRTGDFAEPLYSSLGYLKAGVIPRYARRWNSEELDATTLMYKELQPSARVV
jgi:GNAT superfamily N-acetyltransferase